MNQYKNILVYSLVNLGDVLLTTSATALLRKAYPNAKITMMVRPVVREAVENNPIIDDVILFDYKAKQNSISKMWHMVQTLKKRNFDLAISYDRKLRPALLCRLAGIPVRVGPDKVFDDVPSRVPWFYTDTVPVRHDLVKTLQAETYQEIIRGFTGIDGHESPVMARMTEESRKKAESLLERLPKAEKRIALCVKGTFELKTWPKEYFAEVVKNLAKEYDASFFVVGAPGDRGYSDEVIKEMASVKVQNFCGDTNLVDLASLISMADLLVTVDTGATHIAATTGVPMVVMYGCTSPDRWHPYNENARVLTSREACCPCHVAADACQSSPKPACLWNVTPDMVLKECRSLLQRQ
ncbi:glycosyltransferase family 9 protein [Schwartzia succinivorans]|jgi:lipopolysaccharide heptosyltransferase II|uniref:Lipopolysaccharide heptosyltransferase II n=1 Tax=Schwartzia succinivorans DSM 10502 TaxID=1123243 RepID=A0A1M4XL36_9FIRM|nr:glycosyltransferase family 9 protein [Schwartzia succinivorans]SHE94151.1 lipopolysaccharide heptosyltransferase II [Schwartzia succinivorans DSM 10502]